MTDENELTTENAEEHAQNLLEYAETDTSKGVERDMKRGFVVGADDARYRVRQAHILLDGIIDDHEILSDEAFIATTDVDETLRELASWCDTLHEELGDDIETRTVED